MIKKMPISLAHIKGFAFLASAVMYPVAFYYAHTFFWLSFLYLVPIFYLGAMQRLSWKDGFLWGALTLSTHELWVMCGLYGMASGPWYQRLLPLAALVAFRAIFPAVWFFITDTIFEVGKIRAVSQRTSIFVATAWIYELWMDRFHLWPCGKCEGYIFFNPLMPLAAYPQLLYFLPIVGMPLLLLYLFSCSGMLSYALLIKSPRAWMGAIAMLSVWAFGFVLQQKEQERPVWLDHFGVLQQKFVTRPEMHSVMVLQEQCALLKERYPTIDCILCPESCIYEADLATYLKAYAGQHDAILESLQLVIGGFYDTEDGQRNTAYYINRNREVYRFYKRHAMPLTERIPPILESALFRDLYFSMRPQIVPSNNIRPLWLLGDQLICPYICSELFFNVYSDDYYPSSTILAVCNDVWAPPLVRYVMCLAAIFRAVEWQRPVIYVSYDYALSIDPSGHAYALYTLD